jgi:hypothetical protein
MIDWSYNISPKKEEVRGGKNIRKILITILYSSPNILARLNLGG